MRGDGILATVLVCAAIGLAGCGGEGEKPAVPGAPGTPAMAPAPEARGAPAPAPAAAPAPVTAPAAKVVTVADVEKHSGMTGVKEVAAGSINGANGDLNFATAGGEVLLMVNIRDRDYFEGMKRGGMDRELPGVGDAAFSAPAGRPILVMFRKGERGVWLSTGVAVDREGKAAPLFPIEKMADLAKEIASRL